MDPAQLMLPVLGIAAAAAVTFYAVSFMEMSDKSFEDLGNRDLDEVKLRSSMSAKEKRQAKAKAAARRQQQPPEQNKD